MYVDFTMQFIIRMLLNFMRPRVLALRLHLSPAAAAVDIFKVNEKFSE